MTRTSHDMRRTSKHHKCADCPTMIPQMGGRKRCSPCSDRRGEVLAEKRRRVRSLLRAAKRSKEKRP